MQTRYEMSEIKKSDFSYNEQRYAAIGTAWLYHKRVDFIEVIYLWLTILVNEVEKLFFLVKLGV